MDVLDAARRIFESDLAATLIASSDLSMEKARAVADAIPLERIVEDLGLLVANELADGLEAQGLRPATYVGTKGLGERLAERLRGELSDPRRFLEAFLTQLSARG